MTFALRVSFMSLLLVDPPLNLIVIRPASTTAPMRPCYYSASYLQCYWPAPFCHNTGRSINSGKSRVSSNLENRNSHPPG